MYYNVKSKNSKKNVAIKIFILLLILVIILTRPLISLYNEKTNINVSTQETKEIYSNYESLNQDIIEVLNEMCIKENDIYILKNSYKDNDDYLYFNNILLLISNILNSTNSAFLVENKYDKIHYELINFRKRIVNYKTMLQGFVGNNDIIDSYANSIINILSIDFNENYYSTRINKLFNINGKQTIYNDYMKLLRVEYEITDMMYNIVKYIQSEI